MRWRKPEPEGSDEAKAALRETIETNRSIARKEHASKRVFERLAEIRRRNHIAEAVRDIMEAR